MLPEIFHDSLMRAPEAPVSRPLGEAATNGEDFVSILAEFDLEAAASQAKAKEESAENLTEDGVVELTAEDDHEVPLPDEADFVMEGEAVEETDEILAAIDELIAGPDESAATPLAGSMLASHVSTPQTGGALPSEKEGAPATRMEVFGGSQVKGAPEKAVSAAMRERPSQVLQDGVPAEQDRRSLRPVEATALSEHRSEILRVETASKAARAMPIWSALTRASEGPTLQSATGSPAAEAEATPDIRMQHTLDKADPRLGEVIASRATPVADQPQAESIPRSPRLGRLETTRSDAPPLPGGDIDTVRRATGPEITVPKTSPPPLMSPMQVPSEPRAPFGEEVAGVFPEESLFLTERSAALGRDMFQPLRGVGPMLQPDQPQAMSVIRQVSDAMRLTRGAGVDIALSPEELGSVRLSLVASDGQMSVVVQADRPETLDLMRRNIDSLSQEFRAIGYGDVSFSFQSGGESPQGGRDKEGTSVLMVEEAAVEPRMERQAGLVLGAGLDIRI